MGGRWQKGCLLERKGGGKTDDLSGVVVWLTGSVSFGARLSVYMPFSMDNMDKTDKTQIKNAIRLNASEIALRTVRNPKDSWPL